MTSSINNIYFKKIYLSKKKNMLRFDTFPVFLFLCAMFGVTISGCQLYLWGEHERFSLSPLANAGVPHPEPLQELHGPDSEEVRASRNDLEDFQRVHGPVV